MEDNKKEQVSINENHVKDNIHTNNESEVTRRQEEEHTTSTDVSLNSSKELKNHPEASNTKDLKEEKGVGEHLETPIKFNDEHTSYANKENKQEISTSESLETIKNETNSITTLQEGTKDQKQEEISTLENTKIKEEHSISQKEEDKEKVKIEEHLNENEHNKAPVKVTEEFVLESTKEEHFVDSTNASVNTNNEELNSKLPTEKENSEEPLLNHLKNCEIQNTSTVSDHQTNDDSNKLEETVVSEIKNEQLMLHSQPVHSHTEDLGLEKVEEKEENNEHISFPNKEIVVNNHTETYGVVEEKTVDNRTEDVLSKENEKQSKDSDKLLPHSEESLNERISDKIDEEITKNHEGDMTNSHENEVTNNTSHSGDNEEVKKNHYELSSTFDQQTKDSKDNLIEGKGTEITENINEISTEAISHNGDIISEEPTNLNIENTEPSEKVNLEVVSKEEENQNNLDSEAISNKEDIEHVSPKETGIETKAAKESQHLGHEKQLEPLEEESTDITYEQAKENNNSNEEFKINEMASHTQTENVSLEDNKEKLSEDNHKTSVNASFATESEIDSTKFSESEKVEISCKDSTNLEETNFIEPKEQKVECDDNLDNSLSKELLEVKELDTPNINAEEKVLEEKNQETIDSQETAILKDNEELNAVDIQYSEIEQKEIEYKLKDPTFDILEEPLITNFVTMGTEDNEPIVKNIEESTEETAKNEDNKEKTIPVEELKETSLPIEDNYEAQLSEHLSNDETFTNEETQDNFSYEENNFEDEIYQGFNELNLVEQTPEINKESDNYENASENLEENLIDENQLKEILQETIDDDHPFVGETIVEDTDTKETDPKPEEPSENKEIGKEEAIISAVDSTNATAETEEESLKREAKEKKKEQKKLEKQLKKEEKQRKKELKQNNLGGSAEISSESIYEPPILSEEERALAQQLKKEKLKKKEMKLKKKLEQLEKLNAEEEQTTESATESNDVSPEFKTEEEANNLENKAENTQEIDCKEGVNTLLEDTEAEAAEIKLESKIIELKAKSEEENSKHEETKLLGENIEVKALKVEEKIEFKPVEEKVEKFKVEEIKQVDDITEEKSILKSGEEQKENNGLKDVIVKEEKIEAKLLDNSIRKDGNSEKIDTPENTQAKEMEIKHESNIKIDVKRETSKEEEIMPKVDEKIETMHENLKSKEEIIEIKHEEQTKSTEKNNIESPEQPKEKPNILEEVEEKPLGIKEIETKHEESMATEFKDVEEKSLEEKVEKSTVEEIKQVEEKVKNEPKDIINPETVVETEGVEETVNSKSTENYKPKETEPVEATPKNDCIEKVIEVEEASKIEEKVEIKYEEPKINGLEIQLEEKSKTEEIIETSKEGEMPKVDEKIETMHENLKSEEEKIEIKHDELITKEKIEIKHEKQSNLTEKHVSFHQKTPEKLLLDEEIVEIQNRYNEGCDSFECKPNSGVKSLIEENKLMIGGKIELGAVYLGDKGLPPFLHSIKDLPFESLQLQNQGLRNAATQTIAEALKKHPTVTAINLSSNLISIAGALSLIELVKENTNIKYINLENTYVEQKFKDRIEKYLDKNRSK
ncbi:hypothetical protein ABK040_006661 [Willaertia magna]